MLSPKKRGLKVLENLKKKKKVPLIDSFRTNRQSTFLTVGIHVLVLGIC